MEFSEVENQDDYYSMDAGYIHTQDQQGVYVMYDEALSDLKDLETELLLVASHYIEREKGQKSDFKKSTRQKSTYPNRQKTLRALFNTSHLKL